jgi:hypothetical protein
MCYGDCCGKLYHEERCPSKSTMNQPAQPPAHEYRRGPTPFVVFPYAQKTNRAAESALGIIIRAIQARAAINGGAIDAASGSAQLPRNGFKKKKLYLGHWPSTTENVCPDAGLKEFCKMRALYTRKPPFCFSP